MATPRKKPEERLPLGRPSSYKPEYCDDVIEMAKQGEGWAAYASKFEVDRATLYKWADIYPEFRTALNRAKVEEQLWWESEGRNSLKADRFNALVWKTTVQARFRDDYTEKKITEISGLDGAPIQMQSQVIDARALDEDQRNALKQALIAIKGEESK